MAISLTSRLFHYAQDLPIPVLDHFFMVRFHFAHQLGEVTCIVTTTKVTLTCVYHPQVVRSRLPPCACFEPASQLFVHDPLAYDAYLRGKASVPRQVSVRFHLSAMYTCQLHICL